MLYHPILSVPQKTIYIIACAMDFPMGFAEHAKRLWEKLKTIRREISEKRFFVLRKQFHFYLYSVNQIRRSIIVSRQKASRADPLLSFA